MVRVDNTAAGIVLNDSSVLLVLQDGRAWSLPKGKLEPGEDALSAAKREVYEESGVLDLKFVKELGVYARHRMDERLKDDKNVLKRIVVFLFRTSQLRLSPVSSDVTEARWVPISEAEGLLTHRLDKAFFARVKKVLYDYC